MLLAKYYIVFKTIKGQALLGDLPVCSGVKESDANSLGRDNDDDDSAGDDVNEEDDGQVMSSGRIKKLEIELWNLKVKENNVLAYTKRFQELTLICTKFVAGETEKINKYVSGLPDNIHGSVKASKPKTLDETIEPPKGKMSPGSTICRQKCHKCKKVGHFTGDCKSYGNVNVANAQRNNGANPKGNGCFECGATGHFKRDCPKLKNKDGEKVNAPGWVYAVGNAEKRGNASRVPDSNVFMGTFLLNNHYASNLFYTGADRSFISIAFSSLIDIVPTLLGNSYDVELADGKIVRVDTIMQGCTLNFLNHPFNIDLIPIELGSFNVIIGMDWLRRCHAVIVCNEKLGFLAQISAKEEEDMSKGKQLEDVPVIRDFPKVFPKDLPSLPLARLVMPFGLTNAPAVFMDLINRVRKPYLDKFVIVFINDILIYSKNEKQHKEHLKAILELLKKEKLYAKFSKCEFWIPKVQFLADALSRKERIEPLRVRALVMTIGLDLPRQILEAQIEAPIPENLEKEDVGGMIRKDIPKENLEPRVDGNKALGTDISMSTAYHPKTGGQSEKTIQNLEDMLRDCVIDFGKGWVEHLPLCEFSYNNSYHASIKAAPYEALYGRKCRSPVCWVEVGEAQLTGPERIQETTKKIVLIKQRIQAAQDRQKSYIDLKRNPMDFKVGDRVMLKVSPWKGFVRFGKQGKLNPRYVGPFKVLAKVKKVAYKLELPQELSRVYHTFHVSNLKKCYADEPLVMPLEGIHVDDRL
nr:putative reverse transcriptase domain, ribonuclease H-like domain, aspartic peptidase domain protein [Tanacetum cinerariifolium]